MGHYSLWPIFQLLELDSPFSVESTPSHVCRVSDTVCERIKNDYSFPAACTIRMRFAPKGERKALDVFWYDGGIKPAAPEELVAGNDELSEEGMLFVGDKGKILAGFRSENPQLIPEQKMRAYRAANHLAVPAAAERGAGSRPDRNAAWIASFKGGPASYGDFQLARPITDAVNLASISLRLGGRRLLWDSGTAQITNLPEANKFLTREYRTGWKV
ncbi:MAG: oxidoreductase domain protein [Verrucomicrobiales bacterium]|nr:oxidoreductase domain protein [Verrucomicrobiales bacterium]